MNFIIKLLNFVNMKSELECEHNIQIFQFRLARDISARQLVSDHSKETLQIINECGTYTHFVQLKKQLENDQKLIAQYDKDIDKWLVGIKKEKEFLIYLRTKF